MPSHSRRFSLITASSLLSPVIAITAVTLLAVAGCGGGGSDPEPTPTPSSSVSPSPSPSVSPSPSRIFITGIEPATGPASGGTRVTLRGSGFNLDGPTQFAFYNGVKRPLLDVEVLSQSEARATTPAYTLPVGENVDQPFVMACDGNNACREYNVQFEYRR